MYVKFYMYTQQMLYSIVLRFSYINLEMWQIQLVSIYRYMYSICTDVDEKPGILRKCRES